MALSASARRVRSACDVPARALPDPWCCRQPRTTLFTMQASARFRGPTLLRSYSGLRDEFGVKVTLHRLGAAFRSVSGILDAAEWHFGQRQTEAVDRHHA